MSPLELPPKMAAVVAALNLPVLAYQPGGYLTHPCPHCKRKLLTNLRMLAGMLRQAAQQARSLREGQAAPQAA